MLTSWTVSQSAESTPLTPIFNADFVAMFDKDPGIFTNYAFDAANIAMLTMLAAGNDGAAVKSMLPFISKPLHRHRRASLPRRKWRPGNRQLRHPPSG